MSAPDVPLTRRAVLVLAILHVAALLGLAALYGFGAAALGMITAATAAPAGVLLGALVTGGAHVDHPNPVRTMPTPLPPDVPHHPNPVGNMQPPPIPICPVPGCTRHAGHGPPHRSGDGSLFVICGEPDGPFMSPQFCGRPAGHDGPHVWTEVADDITDTLVEAWFTGKATESTPASLRTRPRTIPVPCPNCYRTNHTADQAAECAAVELVELAADRLDP